MIILAPSETITLTTSAGTVLVDATYADRSGATFQEGNQRTSVTGTSTVVDAPNSGVRMVKNLYVNASTTATITVTVDGAALISKSVQTGATVDLLLDASFTLLSISQVSGLQTALDAKQDDPEVKAADFTAANNGVYIAIATLTVTDPTPSVGANYIVHIRNGTATIGSVGYAAGQDIHRVWHSGAWTSTPIPSRAATVTNGRLTEFDASGNLQNSNVTDGVTGGVATLAATLTSNRTYTFPDAAITVAGSASALTSGRVPYATTGGLLTDSAGMTYNGTSLTLTGTLTVPNGTAAAPGLRLTSEASGLYRYSSTELGFAVAGTYAGRMSSTTLSLNGSLALGTASSISFNGSTGTGGRLLDASGAATTILRSGSATQNNLKFDNTAGTMGFLSWQVTNVMTVLDSGGLTTSAQFSVGSTTMVGSERLRVAGGSIAAAGSTDVIVGGGALAVGATTASTSTTTGALTVAGGMSAQKEIVSGLGFWCVDGQTAPSATAGYAKIYVDTADGDLKIIFGDGTIKTIVTDT